MTQYYDGIQPKPVKWNGVQMRSKLEATWAAFFDICGWRWEYEPETFGLWAPDFVLHGSDGPIWVEVKPIVEVDPNVVAKMVGNAPPNDELLLLGSGVEHGFGWFARERWGVGWTPKGSSHPVDNARFGKGNDQYDFCGENGDYDGRMFEIRGPWGYEDAPHVWAKAKNAVQFMPPA